MRDSIAKVGWLPARTWNAPGLQAGIGSQRRIYLQYRQIHTFGKRKMPIVGEMDVEERRDARGPGRRRYHARA
jgi:hypothetical protein